LGGDFNHLAGRLGIGGNGNLLILLPHLATGIERDGHVAVFSWGNTPLGVVGHRAATTGATARNNQVARAFVRKMKTIGDALALGDSSEVVKVGIEDQNGKPGRLVVTCSGIGVLDEVDVNVGGTPSGRIARKEKEQGQERQKSFHGDLNFRGIGCWRH